MFSRYEIVRIGSDLKLNTANDGKDVVAKLEKVPEGELHALEFSGNTLGVDASVPISEHFAKRSEFEEAHFSDMFRTRLKTEIPPVLKALFGSICSSGARLTILDLSDNAFGPIGVEGIQDFLVSNSAFTLKVLKLNNNGLGIGGGKLLAQSLLTCIERSRAAGQSFAMEVFICGRNRLEDEGATALAKVFSELGSLIELSMPQNGIRPAGIKALAAGLASNLNLRVLNLADNSFTSVGGRAMADTLVTLQQLESVDFDDCLIRTPAFKRILEVLKEGHTELKELRFGGNELGKSISQGIVDLVRAKPGLRLLNLNCNCFGESGIDDLHRQLNLAGREDVLGAFSDDEGSLDSGAESDVEEDGPECDQQFVGGTDEEDEGFSAQQPGSSSYKAKPTKVKEITDLFSQPDAEQRILEAVDVGDPESVVSLVVQLSESIDEQSIAALPDLTQVKVRVIRDAIKGHVNLTSGDNNLLPMNFVNVLAARIGLVKSEDGSHHTVDNLWGVLYLLNELAQENPSVLPQNVKSSLAFLLSGRSKVMEASPELNDLKQATVAALKS